MPYRHAHWFILALVPLIALAFWFSYWSMLGSVSWEFHFHGLTASAWLALLFAQSWSIHHGQRGAHRLVGMASLMLFPLFLAGGIGIVFGMAQRMVEGSEFHSLYAARLTWLDIASVGMMTYFYHEALRHRRSVRLHSGYILATVIALLPPILGRLSGIPLGVTGPGSFHLLEPGFLAAQLLTALIAVVIGWGRGADGRMWTIAAIASVGGGIAYQTIGATSGWRDVFALAASLPPAPFIAATFLAAAAVAWSGWQAGRRGAAGDAVPA